MHISAHFMHEATFVRFPCMFQDILCMEYTFMHESVFHA